MNACAMCNNANTDSTLNENNDLSYIGVGKCLTNYSMFIRSGDNRPTAIVVQHWDELLRQNVTICDFKLSYCPICGRKLFENLRFFK